MIIQKLLGGRGRSVEDVEIQASGADAAQTTFHDVGHLGHRGGEARENGLAVAAYAPGNRQERDHSVAVGGLLHYRVLLRESRLTGFLSQSQSPAAACASIDVETNYQTLLEHGIDKLNRQIERPIRGTP